MLAQVERAYREQAADRVPGVGAASHEHALRHQVPGRRRCRVRPELRRRDRLHRDPQGLRRASARTSAACSTNLKFTLRGESEMMAAILDRHEQPGHRRGRMAEGASRRGQDAGSRACAPSTGVPPMRPSRRRLAARAGGFEDWVVSHKIPVGDAMTVAIDTDQGARHAPVRRHLHRHPRHGRRRDGAAARIALARC